MSDWTPILTGIVGSTAYGLAGPSSDVDRLSFAAAPTVAFHGLHPPTGRNASRVSNDPDVTVHEIGKAVALLLSCNPTVNELLYLPDELYEVRHPLADELIAMRRSLLHARGVRQAYLGYSRQQFDRLRNRANGTFSSDVKNRTAKHARHLWRLCQQAQQLHVTGNLTVKVTHPEICREFAERIVTNPERGLEIAESTLAVTAMMLDTTSSALPAEPDRAAAEAFLVRVRAAFYQPPED